MTEDISNQHEWLRLGAIEKANSIIELTQNLDVKTVLEIGAGTGAILEKLDQHNFAHDYFAVEPSQPLFEYLRDQTNIARLKRVENSVLDRSELANNHFDIAILSHVVEHVPQPAKLIQEAMDIADYVIVEVPLEATMLGNLRAGIQQAITRKDRRANPAGHIQFFSSSKFDSLIRWSGGQILRTRLYVPHPQMNNARRQGPPIRRAYANVTWMASKLLGDVLWSRFYYGHYAVLIQKLNPSDPDVRTEGQPLYYSNE